MVACVSVGLVILWYGGIVDGALLAGIGGGGLLVSAAGFLDDHGDVHPGFRALVQTVAGVWALYWTGTPSVLNLGWGVIPLGWAGAPLALLTIVWLTNLYNFMDGIDGLAASEAAIVGIVGGSLLMSAGGVSLAALAYLLFAAGTGFLIWNRPPARIFMGDVGSGYLGFVFGCLAVAGPSEGVPFLAWILLLGVFIGDATITLLRRVARREAWYRAHRDHAYQRIVRAGWSHGATSAAAAVMTGGLGVLSAVAVAWPTLLVPAFVAGSAAIAGALIAVELRAPYTT